MTSSTANLFNHSIEVIRTRRKKSSAIHINGSKIIIRVPQSFSAKNVRHLLSKHQNWIHQKLEDLQRFPQPVHHQFVQDENFRFLDEEFKLSIGIANKSSVNIEGKNLNVKLCIDRKKQSGPCQSRCKEEHKHEISELIKQWYRDQASSFFTKRTQVYAGIIRVQPAKVTIKNYKSRWGSCSAKAELSYNWRLMMAPEHIIDYVIIHELCHILEHNHSKAYWMNVEKYCPDFKERLLWLKENGRTLIL